MAGWVPYEDYKAGLEAALPGVTFDPRPDPTPVQALARWGVLTGQERTFRCGEGAVAPADAVAHDWGDGLVWFSAAEANARGLSMECQSA